MVSWIPSEIARVGNTVRLREHASGEWTEGWCVEEVWDKKRGADVEAGVMDHKHQRKRTDI